MFLYFYKKKHLKMFFISMLDSNSTGSGTHDLAIVSPTTYSYTSEPSNETKR